MHNTLWSDVSTNNLHIFLGNTFWTGGLICFLVFGASPKMVDDGGWSLLGIGVDEDTNGDGAKLVDGIELAFLLVGAIGFLWTKVGFFG